MRRNKTRKETSAKNIHIYIYISGFKIMKTVVQHFHVFKVFLGSSRSNFANLGGGKSLFLQKAGQGGSKVNVILVYVDL